MIDTEIRLYTCRILNRLTNKDFVKKCGDNWTYGQIIKKIQEEVRQEMLSTMKNKLTDEK